jgi:hypothetical protein
LSLALKVGSDMSANDPENQPDDTGDSQSDSPPGEGADAAGGNPPASQRAEQQAASIDAETRVTTPVGDGKSKIIQTKDEESTNAGATLKIFKS